MHSLVAPVHCKQLRTRHIKDSETRDRREVRQLSPIDSQELRLEIVSEQKRTRDAPIERLAAFFRGQALRCGVFLEKSDRPAGVAVLLLEPVFAGARVVLAINVPALDEGEVVLEVELMGRGESNCRSCRYE